MFNSVAEALPAFTLNVKGESIKSNLEYSIRQQWPQCKPFETQETELILLGGGWSLNNFEDEIHELYANGAKVVTLNGTHQWALDHGLRPSAHVMLDAREFNKRFVENPVETCRYLIASQCHPKVFDALAGYDGWIWHAVSLPEDKEVLDKFYMGRWFPIIGGSTVMLRAFSLLRLLGFRKFRVFGFDSCCEPETGRHHGYEQKENDKADILTFDYKDRSWTCHTWMASQALDFANQFKTVGQDWDLRVYGDGLISHILKHEV